MLSSRRFLQSLSNAHCDEDRISSERVREICSYDFISMTTGELMTEPRSPAQTTPEIDPESPLIPAAEMVLPTLHGDGRRRWLNPALAQGKYWQRRRLLAYGLIAFFVMLPHLRIGGKPIVLLDIGSMQFTFFGHTFYPTDTLLLALLMLAVFFSVMFVTAVGGRLWCGWGCPQTVYLEFLFRPIDRIFSGTAGKGGKPKGSVHIALQAGRFLVYLACSLFLAHTFLSYFVGTDRLAEWMRLSPLEHPQTFAVMAFATIGLMYNFMFFREQLCMVACPYGRFQSVMLDRKSLIVTYDIQRGEPRHKGRAAGENVGDCIDCGHCTAVCPTGIDIRNGLQMECIHCTQCIDACDDVMRRIKKPEGLIRYSSQDALAGNKHSWLRARTLIYPALIVTTSTLFLFVLTMKFAFDVRVLRSPGAPFTINPDRMLQNNFQLRLVNRSQGSQSYHVVIKQPAGATAIWSDNEPHLDPGDSKLVPLRITMPVSAIAGRGRLDGRLEIRDDAGNVRGVALKLLGPE
jgi:cytochrome c oxidase accessory protein FixG